MTSLFFFSEKYGISYENVRIHKKDLLSAYESYDPSEDGLNIVGCPMGSTEFIENFIDEKLIGLISTPDVFKHT